MDPLPPDPYAALSVPRDASAVVIKTAYKKLALKFHPDKAKDKGDEFHRVQQAYELIGEDESRHKYDDQARLADLRKDVYSRRGSGFNPNGDFRFNSNPGAGFPARGPATYEERRPNPANMSSPGPRSPYAEEETFESYFPPPRSGSRKYDGYDANSRKPPSMRTPPTKAAPRAEEKRDAMRQEKVNSSKTRNDKKKQRDQEKGRERSGKFASSFGSSAESDGSDEGYFDSARRRNPQFGQDRPRNENRDDFHGDARSEKLQSQTFNVRDYINRAKAEGGPLEKEPTPQHSRNAPTQELPIHNRPAPQQEPPYEVRRSGRDSRPAMVRKSNPRAKEKTPEPVRPAKATTPKDTRGKAAEKQSSEPSHATSERRPPPPLYTASSSPGNLKIPKSRTMDDVDSQSGGPPRMERSTTMPANPPPLKRSSTRKGSSTPLVSSNLRHAETNDSGYSTSSPSETPQPQQSASTTYHQYGQDTIQVETNGNGYENVLRESNRPLRRSPSPMREDTPRERERRPQLTRERERGPPPRSTSYQTTTSFRPGAELDRERGGPPPRSASYQTAPPSRNDLDLDRDFMPSDRRPSLPNRASSGRVPSSGRTPTLQRGASSPMPPLRTGGMSSNKDRPLFGEINQPANNFFREPNYSPRSGGINRVSDDTEVRYARQATPNDVRFQSYGHGGSAGYSSQGNGGSRRFSEDVGRTKADAANAYIDSTRERSGPGPGGLKRGSTFVY